VKVFFVYSDANSAPLIRIKGLLNLSSRGTMRRWRGKVSVHSVPANYEKPLSVPCHEGVQKAVFDHMFDYRQPWSVRKQWSQELRRASTTKQKRL